MQKTRKTYQPQCKLMLKKKIFRTNGVSSRAEKIHHGVLKEFDLSPFLGDSGSVTVSRSLYFPAGYFEFKFVDRGLNVPADGGKLASVLEILNDLGFSFNPANKPLDSLYGLLEPMDMIEIYMSRSLSKADMPIMMRGMVRKISRTESMGDDGVPSRSVVVTGSCLGAAFDIYKISLIAELGKDPKSPGYNPLMTEADWMRLFGFEGEEQFPQPCDKFMSKIVDLVNEKFMKTVGYPEFIKNMEVKDGVVMVSSLNQYEGALWAAMIDRADTPWNELYVEDTEDGPQVTYRVTPLYDLNDDFCQTDRVDMPGGVVIGGVEINRISADDIVSLEASRDDDRVFNFYVLDSSYISLVGKPEFQKQFLNADYQVFNYENNKPEWYGVRRMDAALYQYPLSVKAKLKGQKEKVSNEQGIDIFNYSMRRRLQLAKMNADNLVFEHGYMTFKGNEAVKIGNYVRVTRGEMINDYYAHTVTHTFTPFKSFMTTVDFIRGTGFIGRNRSEKPPHLTENSKGLNPVMWTKGEPVNYDSFKYEDVKEIKPVFGQNDG